MTALPNLERRDLIVMGSSFKGREYVAIIGTTAALFAAIG